ncbi:hypothetical protein TNCV_1336711 [Trichonephila clavipes]|nr:hypothetical protein TNCV_1336711 [Trichonephila clavipes]
MSERSIARSLTGGCEKWLRAVLPEVKRSLRELYRRSRGLLTWWMRFGAMDLSGMQSCELDNESILTYLYLPCWVPKPCVNTLLTDA